MLLQWIITLMPLLSPSPPSLLQRHEILPLRAIIMATMNPDFHQFFLDKFPTILHQLPALALSALFISSTFFTESISSPKYPAYKAYQKRVAMFWPPMTLIKALKIKLFDGEKEEKEVKRLVWGGSQD